MVLCVICLYMHLHHYHCAGFKVRFLTCLPLAWLKAWCLDPILLIKTKAWAAASGGCFPVCDGGGYVRYNPELQDDEPRIQWAKIKSVDRAVEKAVRVYCEVSLATCGLFHRLASQSLSDGHYCWLTSPQQNLRSLVFSSHFSLPVAFSLPSSLFLSFHSDRWFVAGRFTASRPVQTEHCV